MRNEIYNVLPLPDIQATFRNDTNNYKVVLPQKDLIPRNSSYIDLEKGLRVKAIIEKEYFKSHSVEDLAIIVGTNKCTLNYLFHKITQMSVKQYLFWYRTEIAKELLSNTNYPIKTIAGRVGISRRNFERQFKKLVKMTPYEWRNKEQHEYSNSLQKER